MSVGSCSDGALQRGLINHTKRVCAENYARSAADNNPTIRDGPAATALTLASQSPPVSVPSIESFCPVYGSHASGRALISEAQKLRVRDRSEGQCGRLMLVANGS